MTIKKQEKSSSNTSRGSFSLSVVFVTAFLAIAASFGASKALNGNYTFNLMHKHANFNYWLHKVSPVNLTEAELATYDGRSGRPIYLAVNGSVYDVSASTEMYGPGGSYSFFSGKDGARVYITGCFSTDLTHDLRGVPEEEWIELVAWKLFYETHPKYFKVGTVQHPPIDPSIPPPAPCMLN